MQNLRTFFDYDLSDMGRNWNKQAGAKKIRQLAVRLPDDEKAAAEAFAKAKGYDSVSDWLRHLIRADMAVKKGSASR